MKNRPRAFRRSGVALLLGVVITIAVSWLAMFLPWNDGHWHGPRAVQRVGVASRSDGARSFQIERGHNAWHDVTTYWWMQMSGQSITMTGNKIGDDPAYRAIDIATLPSHMRPESIDDLIMMSWYHATGWPIRAMTCGVHWEKQVMNSDIIYAVTDGVRLPRDAKFNPRALPLRPLWPGFVVNAIVYAGAWWLLIWIACALRRRHRAKQHRCVDCGYARTGLPRKTNCPECGTRP